MATRAELRAEQADCVARLKDAPDEFHPDPRVAAAFADLKANQATINWLEKEVKRREALGDKASSRELVELGISRQLLKDCKAERRELEEVAAQWLPASQD